LYTHEKSKSTLRDGRQDEEEEEEDEFETLGTQETIVSTRVFLVVHIGAFEKIEWNEENECENE
jgi:hypothetical protein